MDEERIDLRELCRRADVTPRTVRYYIQQGLLPAASSSGPGAKYGRPHLDRLLLIKRLQQAYLPLAEIRKQLESLDETSLRRAAGQSTPKWAARRIAIQAAARDGRLVIAIGDDGPGIAPELRATALQRGSRLDERMPGSGLGLTIAQELAKLYGGSLTLGQSPLGGLLVTVDLPAA